MAKVSPVMKHAKPKLTAEQIAIEDFMQSIPPQVVIEGDTIIDNTIPEMIVQEDTSLDPIVEAAVAADNIDALAEDVDGITTAASMESFRRIFTHMTEMSGFPVASLENFPTTKGGVRKFAKAVRGHASEIRECVHVALEDYAGKTQETIGTSVSNFKQALGELAKIKESDIDTDKKVTVDHKEFWKLFQVNEDLIDLADFKQEIDNVKKLAEYVTKGKDHIVQWSEGKDSKGHAIEGKAFIQLMNNTDVNIKDGRASFTEEEVLPPSKEWTKGDWFWNIVGGNIAQVARGTFTTGGGSGKSEADVKHNTKNIAQAIRDIKTLGPVVQKIENDAKEIVKTIDATKEDRKADLKRAAAPVLELASKTIQHVTKVAYGLKKLFDAAK